MDYKETSAKTVQEAITQACVDLGVPSDLLDYEVVSEGSRGFFGFGNKPAVIRYRRKEEPKPEQKERPPKKGAPEYSRKSVLEQSDQENRPARSRQRRERRNAINDSSDSAFDETRGAGSRLSGQPAEEVYDVRGGTSRQAAEEFRDVKTRASRQTEGGARESKSRASRQMENSTRDARTKASRHPADLSRENGGTPVIRSDEEIAFCRETADEFLNKIFEAMELPVKMKYEYLPESNCLEIELSGQDMGALIGKRGQTLDSLQYLVSLVVNRKIKEYLRIKLDTEDYRRRRKETLENLARNIAARVKKTKKTVVLEPMNPYERRIIHSTLQADSLVETYSEGNEPYRHVVVTLKKQ